MLCGGLMLPEHPARKSDANNTSVTVFHISKPESLESHIWINSPPPSLTKTNDLDETDVGRQIALVSANPPAGARSVARQMTQRFLIALEP